MKRILGIDPGLQKTGWGLIEKDGNTLRFIASGLIRTNAKEALCARLACIDREIRSVVQAWDPCCSAVEETFMNNNAASALLLGQARGAAIVALARENLGVAEYAATLVKKSIVGNGHAQKGQMGMMVSMLLPGASAGSEDEFDALAVAICHAHHAVSAPVQNSLAGAGK